MVTLEANKLFGQLSPPELSALRHIAREQTYSAGQEIFKEGDKGDGVYVVRDGLVEISGLVDQKVRLVLSQVGPGDIFGEMAVIEAKPRSAGAVAKADIKALSQISGVGRKTAERIVVELKDKIGMAGAWEASSAQRGLSETDQRLNDAVLALMALGFKQLEAHDSVRKAQAALGPQATVEDLVRACLKKSGA